MDWRRSFFFAEQSEHRKGKHMKEACKKKDCEYWIDTPLGDSHAKCMTCCRSAWLPKSDKDNYKPNAGKE